MNSDDKEFFNAVRRGSNNSLTDVFVVVAPIPHNKALHINGWKNPDINKVFPNFTAKTIASFSVPSLKCSIIYASTIPILVAQNSWDSIRGIRGRLTPEQSRNWQKEQDKINKNVSGQLVKRLDNTIRTYLAAMKRYCSITEGNEGDTGMKRWNVIDAKYKLNETLSYLQQHRPIDLNNSSGNAHVDRLQLLLKAHKTISNWAVDNSKEAKKKLAKELSRQFPKEHLDE